MRSLFSRYNWKTPACYNLYRYFFSSEWIMRTCPVFASPSFPYKMCRYFPDTHFCFIVVLWELFFSVFGVNCLSVWSYFSCFLVSFVALVFQIPENLYQVICKCMKVTLLYCLTLSQYSTACKGFQNFTYSHMILYENYT